MFVPTMNIDFIGVTIIVVGLSVIDEDILVVAFIGIAVFVECFSNIV